MCLIGLEKLYNISVSIFKIKINITIFLTYHVNSMKFNIVLDIGLSMFQSKALSTLDALRLTPFLDQII